MKFLVCLLGKIPLGIRVRIGRTCGCLFSLFPTRERKVAELQMRLFLKDAYSKRLLRELYCSLGETALESINLRPILDNHERLISAPEWDVADRVTATKRPIVCLTAHLGNWDLLAAYCIKRGIPITTIGREARSGSMQNVLSEIRGTYGVKTIWRSDKNAVKAIMQELKERTVVAALIDQDTDVSSSFVPFFGMPVRCPSGIVAIAKRMDAIVTAAFLVRIGRGRYCVHTHELDGTKDVEGILLEYHALLEHYIKLFPAQWVWVHKRWRTFQDGQRLSSREYISYLTRCLRGEMYV